MKASWRIELPSPFTPPFPLLTSYVQNEKTIFFDKFIVTKHLVTMIKCCEYMRNNVWQQNEINVLKFWFSFFFPNWVELDICAFANKGLYDGEIKLFVFCLIFVYHNKMHVVKVFIFAVFRHNSSTNRCSIGIKKLPIILQVNFLANTRLNKCRNYGFFCLGNVTLVINGINF